MLALALMIAISSVGAFFHFVVFDHGCDTSFKDAGIECKNLSSMVEQYMLKGSHSKLPDTLEDLTQGRNPITKKIPQDPWGTDYIYRKTGDRQFEIFSAGPDGEAGTEDDITAED